MAVGPVGQRPLEQPNAAAAIVQLSEQSPVNPSGQSHLIPASSRECCTDSCVKNIPVIGWLAGGIVSICNRLINFALSCCGRAPNPPIVPVSPIPAPVAQPAPVEAPASAPVAQPARVEAPAPAPVAQPARAEAPVPAPVPQPARADVHAPEAEIEDNAVGRLQRCMREFVDTLGHEDELVRLPLLPVPENRFGENIPVALPEVGAVPTFNEALVGFFRTDQEALESARQFEEKVTEVAGKLSEIYEVEERMREAVRGRDAAEIREIQRELEEEKEASRELFRELTQLNAGLNVRVVNRLDALIANFEGDINQLAGAVLHIVYGEANPTVHQLRLAKAIVILEKTIEVNSKAEEISINAISLSQELNKTRIDEIIAARAQQEGITVDALLQRFARLEGIENFAQATADVKSRISLRAASDGNDPAILLEMPRTLNKESMRLIALLSEQLSTAPARLTNVLTEQLGANVDVFPLAQTLAERVRQGIDGFGRQARRDRAVVQGQVLNFRDQIRDDAALNEVQREQLLRLQQLRHDVDIYFPALLDIGQNVPRLTRITRVFALVRKVEERKKQAEEYQALRDRIVRAQTMNAASIANDDGILLHKALIHQRSEELQGEERQEFQELLVHRIGNFASKRLLVQQSIMASAVVMAFEGHAPEYMMPHAEIVRQLQACFHALSPDVQNEVIENLYENDADELQNPQAVAVWNLCHEFAALLVDKIDFKVSVEGAMMNHKNWFYAQLETEVPAFADLNEEDQELIYAYIYSDQALAQNIPQIMQNIGPTVQRLRTEHPDMFNGSRDRRRQLERHIRVRSRDFSGLSELSKTFIINFILTPPAQGLDINQRLAPLRGVLQDCRAYIARRAAA